MHRVSLTGAHPVDPERAPATVVQQVVSQHGGAQLAYYLAILRPHDGEVRSLESQTDPGNPPTPLRLLIAANARATHVLRRHVQETLSENGCLPTQVVDRLAQERIRPGG